jgi:hypothetical protein
MRPVSHRRMALCRTLQYENRRLRIRDAYGIDTVVNLRLTWNCTAAGTWGTPRVDSGVYAKW